jgi:nuclear pore complex protein Nup205
VRKDFVASALFLSDQLDINEHVAATLLMRSTTESSRVSSDPVDTAVILYHGERGYLLACLDVILKTARDDSVSDHVRAVCRQFMQEIIGQPITAINNSTIVSYVSKLISTLENLSKSIKAIRNTGSIVGKTPDAGSGKLGEHIYELRIESLADERISIAQIIYHVTSLYDIDTKDRATLLGLLEEAELTDPATAYVIIAMVATLSQENQREEQTPSSATMEFINTFHNRLMSRGSKVPVIKAVIVLQWVLYLRNPVREKAVIDAENTKITDQVVKDLLTHAIDADVFGFMNEYFLYFKQVNAVIDTGRKVIKYEDSDDSNTTKMTDTTNYHNFNADIRIDFQPFVIHEIGKVVISIITTLRRYLQELKLSEEDTNISVQTPHTTENTTDSKEPCRDLQHFLTLLASVYRDRINEGIIFWRGSEQNGLLFFTKWLLDIKVEPTICAAFDFLGSIATGDTCALEMYKLFDVGVGADIASYPLFSWGKLFSALEFHANNLKNVTEDKSLSVIEHQLLLNFLTILKQTVQYSKDARKAFWPNNNFKSPHVLLEIINRKTSRQLRAAVYDVLSAFCSAWGGGVEGLGREISLDVWRFFEGSDMLVGESQSIPGLLQEFQIEKISRMFPATLSFIRLIGSAIHTQSKREALVSGFQAPEPSIPLDLGKGTENPGATPFISLIVDDIFVNLGSQVYAFAEGRWQLTEACLMVMENSVESFDLEMFEDESIQKYLDEATGPTPGIESTLLWYLTHPGFQVMSRILSGKPLVAELFNVIEECAKKETKEVENMPYHKQCLLRALRILLRVLDLQNTFCRILIPYINSFSKRTDSSKLKLGDYAFNPLPSVVPLIRHILFKAQVLDRIALLVNYEDQEEICFLSTKILHGLTIDNKEVEGTDKFKTLTQASLSASLTGLGSSVTSVLSSGNSPETIIFGFSERLSINLPEVMTCDDYEYDTSNIPFWHAQTTMENTYNYPNDYQPRIKYSVRLAILDLLLENAKQQKTSPTLTEFLLGYDLSKTNTLNKIQDTEVNQPRLVCFHAILDIMRQGIEKNQALTGAMIEDTAEPTLPLIDTHPILAEKCYELIYRFCANESLSLSTMRYLRNRENFFYKQFQIMSSRLEYNIQVDSPTFSGTMILADGTQIKTDFFKLRSKLHQRAWLLHCIALELHTTIAIGQKTEASKLLELLYGRKNVRSDDDMDTSDQQEISMFTGNPSQTFQQPLVKMLELVSSLEFAWLDDLENAVVVKMKDLHYWKEEFYENKFEITNERGCRIYDVRKAYRDLHSKHTNKYADTLYKDAAETEMGSILSFYMAENHRREIAHGKLHCLKAWKEVIHVTLIECFDLIGVETRENMVHELLQMLLEKMAHTKNGDNMMLKSMSEIVCALVIQLRKDESSKPASQLPIEKLKLFFSGIVDSICRKDTSFEVRGDLYSAMNSFLMYINGHGRDRAYKQLETHIIGQISAKDSKLLHTLCNDATYGLDIWKTTSFIGLDALNNAALQAGSSVVQNDLIDKNFLRNTIEEIRNEDKALTNLLEQTDGKMI